MSTKKTQRKFLSVSGQVTSKPSQLIGWTSRVSADSTIQIYEGESEGTDDELLSELDVLSTDKSGGVMSVDLVSLSGIYCKITGTARVIVYYKEYDYTPNGNWT